MDKKLDLTTIILTKNEQENLVDCLESVKWSPHIMVIDDESEDYTVDIARQQGIKVIKNKLENFADQRNLGLSKAQTTWVLFIDADERVPPELAMEIKLKLQTTTADAFQVRRNDYFINKLLENGETNSWNQVRLAKKDAGKWVGAVHEEWQIEGEVDQLETPLNHQSHSSISGFLKKINTYTTIRAQELKKTKQTTGVWQIIVYPIAKFIKNYVLLRGYKDGTHGFVHASLMAFHSYLVRSKHFLLTHKTR